MLTIDAWLSTMYMQALFESLPVKTCHQYGKSELRKHFLRKRRRLPDCNTSFLMIKASDSRVLKVKRRGVQLREVSNYCIFEKVKGDWAIASYDRWASLVRHGTDNCSGLWELTEKCTLKDPFSLIAQYRVGANLGEYSWVTLFYFSSEA